jgi:Arc/MetJ-type ribon-helix-helix transcriptional regulator
MNAPPTESLPRKRPGRRPAPGLSPITVVLDDADTAAIDMMADELRRSRSDLVREAIREWLARTRMASPRR